MGTDCSLGLELSSATMIITCSLSLSMKIKLLKNLFLSAFVLRKYLKMGIIWLIEGRVVGNYKNVDVKTESGTRNEYESACLEVCGEYDNDQ